MISKAITEEEMETLKELYQIEKKELLMLQIRRDLNDEPSFRIGLSDIEYQHYLDTMQLVSNLNDIIKSRETVERRRADNDVFWDRRNG